jgi:hypothetical protein
MDKLLFCSSSRLFLACLCLVNLLSWFLIGSLEIVIACVMGGETKTQSGVYPIQCSPRDGKSYTNCDQLSEGSKNHRQMTNEIVQTTKALASSPRDSDDVSGAVIFRTVSFKS